MIMIKTKLKSNLLMSTIFSVIVYCMAGTANVVGSNLGARIPHCTREFGVFPCVTSAASMLFLSPCQISVDSYAKTWPTIVLQLSKCLKLMTVREECFVIRN